MKVKNRLLDSKYNIYQDDEWFKFSLDSVLLANFVTINLRTKSIVDLATGNAPIPMLFTFRTNAHIFGIEYQDCVYDLAVESIKENNLEDKVEIIRGDVRNISNYFESDSIDIVTCNPPYFKLNSDSYINDNKVKRLARHEITLNLEDVIKSANYLLKNGGTFAMVHRTERIIEIIELMKKYNIEPKKMQFVYSKKGKNSDLFLIEGNKNGKIGLKMLSPIVVHEENNDYTKEVSEILNLWSDSNVA